MPIYEYKCAVCGQHFEKLVMEQGETVTCPKCGDTHPERKLSAFSSQSLSPFQAAARSCGGSGGFS